MIMRESGGRERKKGGADMIGRKCVSLHIIVMDF